MTISSTYILHPDVLWDWNVSFFFCTVCLSPLRNVYLLVSALILVIRILPLKTGNYLRNIRPRPDANFYLTHPFRTWERLSSPRSMLPYVILLNIHKNKGYNFRVA